MAGTHLCASPGANIGSMVEQRVWLITGASCGLGHAIAEAALAAGDVVAGAARSERGLRDLVAIDPARAMAVELDVADPARIPGAVSRRRRPGSFARSWRSTSSGRPR
jgi:NADP-dependent 3-hydroxy acid dehydrogenase YdfG